MDDEPALKGSPSAALACVVGSKVQYSTVVVYALLFYFSFRNKKDSNELSLTMGVMAESETMPPRTRSSLGSAKQPR